MTLLVTKSKNAPFGRLVAGVSVPSMLMTIAPPLTFPVQPTAALFTSDTLTLAVIVRRLWLDYFITS